jgi:hypothetical protein
MSRRAKSFTYQSIDPVVVYEDELAFAETYRRKSRLPRCGNRQRP